VGRKTLGVNRREFVARAAGLAFAGSFFPAEAFAATLPSYHEELPDMLLLYLTRKTNALAAEWDRERDRVRTPADLEVRNRFVREKSVEMIHGLPERNLLNPVTVGSHERDGYRIENVMFQSRPNFWVTGNLYVPTTGPGPFPGIISPCGHYAEARMDPEYQSTYVDLVRSGFVVLGYDPIGQGERRQFWNPQTNRNEIGGPVTWEHALPGQLLLLLGESLTQYRIWDGMRAIDYLLTRPEVDKEKIGCTGHSGGGFFTLLISALDERVRCAAINEGGTAHRWPVEMGPATRVETGDVEQHFFPAAIYGVDLCDLHVAIAPRPLLATKENFSPEFNQVAQHVLARYQQLGVPERFATEEADDPHAMTMKLRLATTDWFCRWFYDRRGPTRELEFQPEAPATLHCTRNGSQRFARQGDTIFTLISKKQASLPPPRQTPATLSELESYRRALGSEIRDLLRYRESDQSLGVRRIVNTPRRGYQIEKVEFLSEPGIYIPAWVFVPEKRSDPRRAVVYASEAGKDRDGMEFGLLERLARRGHLVIAVDVRGIGETTPPHPDDEPQCEFRQLDNVETVMTYMAWEMNESLFGMRVRDVVRSVDYALSRPDAGGVRVIGKGMGALWALFAAALDPRIQSVVCDSGLLSYRSLTGTDRYLHEASIFIPGVLRNFDLPQVAAAVAGRPLALLAPVDAMKMPVELGIARKAYEGAQAVYTAAGAADRFQVVGRSEKVDRADQYLDLLNA